LVPPRDPEALAGAMDEALRNEPLRREHAASARARASRLFTHTAMVRRTESICLAALSGQLAAHSYEEP
jgi:glycosyltransferase involved in cell wall biosynthesis